MLVSTVNHLGLQRLSKEAHVNCVSVCVCACAYPGSSVHYVDEITPRVGLHHGGHHLLIFLTTTREPRQRLAAPTHCSLHTHTSPRTFILFANELKEGVCVCVSVCVYQAWEPDESASLCFICSGRCSDHCLVHTDFQQFPAIITVHLTWGVFDTMTVQMSAIQERFYEYSQDGCR